MALGVEGGVLDGAGERRTIRRSDSEAGSPGETGDGRKKKKDGGVSASERNGRAAAVAAVAVVATGTRRRSRVRNLRRSPVVGRPCMKGEGLAKAVPRVPRAGLASADDDSVDSSSSSSSSSESA